MRYLQDEVDVQSAEYDGSPPGKKDINIAFSADNPDPPGSVHFPRIRIPPDPLGG